MSKTRTATVYHFIEHYLKKQGYPPGLEEIGAYSDLSTEEVQTCLERLESVGMLSFRPDRPRGLRLTLERPIR